MNLSITIGNLTVSVEKSLEIWLRQRSRWTGLVRGWLSHELWKNKNFHLLLATEFFGMMGGQFFQIALPWLVMQLTGSAMAMGTAIVLAGLARAAFVMVGGTLCDRFSPRTLILAANAVRVVVLALFTLTVAVGWIDLLPLYGFNIALALTDAVLIPARGSLIPRLVHSDQILTANALSSGQEKVWSLAGPALVGFAITWVDRASGYPHLTRGNFYGVNAAFVIYLLALLLSLAIFRLIRLNPSDVTAGSEAITIKNRGRGFRALFPAGSFKELFRVVWGMRDLRISFLAVYLIGVLSGGPLYIGLPILAVSRFSNGAEVLGLLQSAAGFGALIGTLLAATQPQPRRIGRVFLVAVGVLAAGLVTLVLAWSVLVAGAAVLAITAVVGFITITGTSQIQRSTPPAFLGRVMGLLNLK